MNYNNYFDALVLARCNFHYGQGCKANSFSEVLLKYCLPLCPSNLSKSFKAI